MLTCDLLSILSLAYEGEISLVETNLGLPDRYESEMKDYYHHNIIKLIPGYQQGFEG